MRIGILGSTGQAGQRIARMLAMHTNHYVTLLGRHAGKLSALQSKLTGQTGKAFTCSLVDITSLSTLCAAFATLDLVVVATSSYKQLPTVIQAAVITQTDLFDIMLGSPEKLALLKSFEAALNQAGLCYITDGGYHPGVPAALIRHASTALPDLRDAFVYGSFGVDWKANLISSETVLDFVSEMANMDTSAMIDGKWIKSWKNMKPFTFPAPAQNQNCAVAVGRQNCIAMGMEELRALPALIPSLRNTGFYIAGFGPVMDFVIMPLCLAAIKLAPFTLPAIARLFGAALKHLTNGQSWAYLSLEARSPSHSFALSLSYPDPYDLTAIPVVACIEQYASGAKRAGLYLQALFVDPARLIADLKRMGVDVVETASQT